MQGPKEVAHRWFEEVWNRGNEKVIDELLSPEAEVTGLGEGDQAVKGPKGFKPFFRNLRSAFPDIKVTPVDSVVEGNKIALRLLITGTHKGEGLGIKATGKSVRIEAIVMAKIKGGKILTGWNSWDQLGLLQQLGA